MVLVENVTTAEAEMNAFLLGHRVPAVKKEYVANGENSFSPPQSIKYMTACKIRILSKGPKPAEVRREMPNSLSQSSRL